MKMNKWGYMILCSLISNHALSAPPVRSAMVKNLNVRFESIKSNLRLINKCYLTRSKKCTADERAQAWEALKNTGIVAGGLIGLLLAGKWVWDRGKKDNQPSPEPSRTPTSGPEELHQEKMRKKEEDSEYHQIFKLIKKQSGGKWLLMRIDKGSGEIHATQSEGGLDDEKTAQDVINKIHEINPAIRSMMIEPGFDLHESWINVYANVDKIINSVTAMTPRGSKVTVGNRLHIHLVNLHLVKLEIPNDSEFTDDDAQNVINKIHRQYPSVWELYLINSNRSFWVK